MKMTMTRLNAVGSRYLAAYLDLADASKSQGNFAERDFAVLAELCQIPEFAFVIQNPMLKPEQLLDMLGQLFPLLDLHLVTQNFLRVLAQNARFNELTALVRAFPRSYAEKQGLPLVDVVSPAVLNEADRKDLVEALKAFYHKDIFIAFDTDPSLLGGLIVKVGSEMLDTSLKSKLNRMQTYMKGVA